MKRFAAAIGIAAASFVTLHELGRRWGATNEELSRQMPGHPQAGHRRRNPRRDAGIC
jgi:hypothetical protein